MLPLAVALVSSCAAPAASGPGSEPDIEDPGPDFGYIPNAIGIVQPGRAYIETAVEHERGPEAGQDLTHLVTLARIGVVEDLEARVLLWPVQYSEDDDGSTTGSGPLQVGLKKRVSRGGGSFLTPAWGFELEVLLPTSTGGFDSGELEPQAWVNFDHTVSEQGLFTWNGGVLFPVDDSGTQFAQTYLAAAYSEFVARDVQAYATGSWYHPTPDGSSSTASLGAGLYWYFTRRAVLVAGYNAGLNSESADLATLGVSLAF